MRFKNVASTAFSAFLKPSINNSTLSKAAQKHINSFNVFSPEDYWKTAQFYAEESKKSATEVKTAFPKITPSLKGVVEHTTNALPSIPYVGGGLFVTKLGLSLVPKFLLKSAIQIPLSYMLSNPLLTTLGLVGLQIAKEPKNLKDTTENIGKVLYHTPLSLYNASRSTLEATKALTSLYSTSGSTLEATKALMMPKKYNTYVYGETEDTVVIFPALCENKGKGIKEYSIYKSMKPDSEFLTKVPTDTFLLDSTHASNEIDTNHNINLLGNAIEGDNQYDII